MPPPAEPVTMEIAARAPEPLVDRCERESQKTRETKKRYRAVFVRDGNRTEPNRAERPVFSLHPRLVFPFFRERFLVPLVRSLVPVLRFRTLAPEPPGCSCGDTLSANRPTPSYRCSERTPSRWRRHGKPARGFPSLRFGFFRVLSPGLSFGIVASFCAARTPSSTRASAYFVARTFLRSGRDASPLVAAREEIQWPGGLLVPGSLLPAPTEPQRVRGCVYPAMRCRFISLSLNVNNQDTRSHTY